MTVTELEIEALPSVGDSDAQAEEVTKCGDFVVETESPPVRVAGRKVSEGVFVPDCDKLPDGVKETLVHPQGEGVKDSVLVKTELPEATTLPVIELSPVLLWDTVGEIEPEEAKEIVEAADEVAQAVPVKISVMLKVAEGEDDGETSMGVPLGETLPERLSVICVCECVSE